MRHTLKLRRVWLTCAVVAAAASPACAGLRSLFDAIRQVETGGHSDPANARGDGGRSLGPYQITLAYWKDSSVAGRYEMVRDRAYAERVMKAYWQRYCPSALDRGDWRTLAQVHNGGPNGPRVSKATAYWAKVRRALNEGEEGPRHKGTK